jgi:hypothetical protein
MQTRIELLKQAGFSDAEIGDWATAERQRMNEQGFTDDEIDEEFGVTRPPKEVPEAFIERLKQGNAAQRIAGVAGDYAHRYFGDEPLGFSPRNEEFLRKLGAAGDIIIPAAKPVDAVLRAVPAGLAALGAGFGQTLEEAGDATFGPGPQAKGKAARDFASLAQIAALLSGASRTMSAPVRVPEPKVTAAPAIVLPRAEDFRNAAAAISGTPASFRTEQKLLQLYKERGLTPAEVAQEAMRDPALAAALASESDKLPEALAGGAKETTKEGARAEAKVAASETPAAGGEHAPATTATPAEADRPADSTQRQPGATAENGPPAPDEISRASANPWMYDPPAKDIRPFEADYRKGVQADEQGRLTAAGLSGAPLNPDARWIVGRRVVGGVDRGIPHSRPEYDALATATVGRRAEVVEPSLLPKSGGKAVAGATRIPAGSIFPDRIRLNSKLSQEDALNVYGHEIGHVHDEIVGQIQTKGLMTELKTVYNDLNNPDLALIRKDNPSVDLKKLSAKYRNWTPENNNYKGAEVNREYVAEAFRAYMRDPNYLKSVAPKTAAAIQSAVNPHWKLRNIIQFNTLGPLGMLGVAGAIAAAKSDDE